MSAHPDSNLYPEASGPAKALVDRRRPEQPLKLYAGWLCPYVQPPLYLYKTIANKVQSFGVCPVTHP